MGQRTKPLGESRAAYVFNSHTYSFGRHDRNAPEKATVWILSPAPIKHPIRRLYHICYTSLVPNCIFCKIVRGELPSIKVCEDAETIAILTIEPVNTGHTLVIPKEHVANVFEATPEVWAKVQETVRKVAHAVEKGVSADGVNINMNNREHAGQVVDHIHVHIIPRFKGDGFSLWPHHDRKEEAGDPIAAKIRAAF